MGEVIPGECITNALHKNENTKTLSSSWDGVQIWEEWKLMANCTVETSQAMVEPIEEDKEEVDGEEDMGEGTSTADLAPKQAPALWETMHEVPKFWAEGPSIQVARIGPAASSKARGRVLAIQVELLPPAEIHKELAC